jgi:hypothetical protein
LPRKTGCQCCRHVSLSASQQHDQLSLCVAFRNMMEAWDADFVCVLVCVKLWVHYLYTLSAPSVRSIWSQWVVVWQLLLWFLWWGWWWSDTKWTQGVFFGFVSVQFQRDLVWFGYCRNEQLCVDTWWHMELKHHWFVSSPQVIFFIFCSPPSSVGLLFLCYEPQ